MPPNPRLAPKRPEQWLLLPSMVPVRDFNGVVLLDNDEHRRPGSTVESLAVAPGIPLTGCDGRLHPWHRRSTRMSRRSTCAPAATAPASSTALAWCCSAKEAGSATSDLRAAASSPSPRSVPSSTISACTGPTLANTELALSKAQRGQSRRHRRVRAHHERLRRWSSKWEKDPSIPTRRLTPSTAAPPRWVTRPARTGAADLRYPPRRAPSTLAAATAWSPLCNRRYAHGRCYHHYRKRLDPRLVKGNSKANERRTRSGGKVAMTAARRHHDETCSGRHHHECAVRRFDEGDHRIVSAEKDEIRCLPGQATFSPAAIPGDD